MIQIISIFLFLPFTSVLAYPPSINKNNDRFELSNEFLIRHFGSDFKDAVRFNIQPSSIPNTANILHKHFPENMPPNRNFKRSYEMHTPQIVQQQNRMPENFMKVQLLTPAEIEALEGGMRGKEMYKSPVVVTLPDFTGMTPGSFNGPQLSPIAPNTAPVAYQHPRLQPNFFQNNQAYWPQSPQYAPYNPQTVYQQQQSRPLVEDIRQQQPSFGKFLMMKPMPYPSYQSSLHNIHDQISLPAKENKIETLEQPSVDELVESSHQQSSDEKSFEEQSSNEPSTLEQSSSGQNLQETINEPSLEQTTQTIIDKLATSTDEMQSSIDKMQPLTIKMQPLTDETDPLTIKLQPLTDDMQPFTDQMQPITIKMQPLEDTIQPLTDKVQPLTDKEQPSCDKMQPSTDKQHQSPIDKTHQSPTDQTQSTSDLMNPSNIAVQPFYRNVHATFEKTPDSYPTLRHPSYKDISSSYRPQPSTDELRKHYRYEEYHSSHPYFHRSRMTSFDQSSSSDSIRHSSPDKNHDQDSLDAARVARHDYRYNKKTTP